MTLDISNSEERGMLKKDYLGEPWRALLCDQGLTDFEVLWNLELDSIDEVNFRRGGWSRAHLMPLRAADGVDVKMIVKRQVNYFCRTPAHPIRGIPTLKREFANIQLCRELGIPTAQAVYYADRRDKLGYRAILVTKFLEGYVSLHDLVLQWEQEGWPRGDAMRMEVMETVARLARQLHRHRLRHGHLQPKHILIDPVPGEVDARLIDLESMYRTLTVGQCSYADLVTMNRHLKRCHTPDRMRFMHMYTGLDRLDGAAKRLCRRILRRTQKSKA